MNGPFLLRETLNSMWERVAVVSVWWHFTCDQIRVFAYPYCGMTRQKARWQGQCWEGSRRPTAAAAGDDPTVAFSWTYTTHMQHTLSIKLCLGHVPNYLLSYTFSLRSLAYLPLQMQNIGKRNVLLCLIIWDVPRRVVFNSRRFATLCLFQLYRQVAY
jgi:hypothetical protein